MKTFDEIYEELQNTNNNELNEAWKEASKEREKSKKIALIICLVIDTFFILQFLKQGFNYRSLFFIFFAVISNIMIYASIIAIFSKGYRNYSKIYKNTVISKLMSNFYNNLEYYPKKPMPRYIYDEGQYREYYNIYRSEDYMEAQINNKYSIQLAEILTQEERTTTDSEGNIQTETITKFCGLFAKIFLQKSIKGDLKIVRNGSLLFDRKRLEMDSSEFEKYFDVKASDKILGMRLLTADVMEELIEFQDKTNIKYDVYIRDSELYLRFHSGPMFEVGKLKNGAIDKETLRKYFFMLNFIYNLSNKLINLVNETEI